MVQTASPKTRLGSVIRARIASTTRRMGAARTTAVSLFAGLPVGLGVVLGASYYAFAALPPVPVPPENPITEQKRVLGKMLFWDEQLSTSNVVSCGTCHVPARGGADNRIARNPGIDLLLNTPDDILGSAGVIRSDSANEFERDPVFALRPQITNRAANSNINSGYATDLFWDGRARSTFTDPQTGLVAIANGGALESQAVAPPTNTIEMAHAGVDWTMVSAKLRTVQPLALSTNIPADVRDALASEPNYPELFRRAFGDDQINARRIAFAIATYQRTLIADQTPWDRFQAGEVNAMSPQQQQGWTLFQQNGPGQARCNACHTAPLFTTVNPLGQSFRNIGLRPIAEDTGRQIVTGNPGDAGRFKIPSLRNVGLKTTFMHNGMFQVIGPNTGIPDVLRFYARAPGAPTQFPQNLDPIIPTIGLPPQNAGPIADFITNALTDPRVANQTFPFDRPTLFVDRPQDRATPLGGGVVGTGGFTPTIIVQEPPMAGNMTFRIGLDGALGGTTARLGVSRSAPVSGRITPEFFLDAVATEGIGAGQGIATAKWPLTPGVFTPGQVFFVQWFVNDSAAAGGQALSNPARMQIFCGSMGCVCDSLDFNQDGLTPDSQDLDDFLAVLSGGPNACSTSDCNDVDFNNDGLFPDSVDLDSFISKLGGGPCV
jgi:cytochrome c peroxidase